MNGKTLTAAERPVIQFAESYRMTGFGGCNSVNADFRIQVRSLRFGPLNFTTNKCDAEIEKLELTIFRALQFAETWKIVGNRTIEVGGKAGTLVLGPAF